mgnify:CR=1 FL=1
MLKGIECRRIQARSLTSLARERVAMSEQTIVTTYRRWHPVLVVRVLRARRLPSLTRSSVQVIKVRTQQEPVRLCIAYLAAVEEEVRIQSTGLGDYALEIKGLLFACGKCTFSELESLIPRVAASDTCQPDPLMSYSDLHE